MRRSVTALLSAAVAVVLAGGGYAIGAGGQDGATAKCEQTTREFAKRANELKREVQKEDDRWQVVTAQTEILAGVVKQNSACFDAGTRSAAEVVQRLSGGAQDAARCDLIGIKATDCSVES
ncbi:hypothetical protein ACFY2Z_36510 [Streptomyces sp. NPDC001222]|uniref:hypothetical protein n=1 Tax=Streptomyces sp. NPDC001222 TaxID=3364548 RepID=UPI003682B652